MPRGRIVAMECVAAALATLFLFGGGLSTCAGDEPAAQPARIGTVTHPPIKEASALVASRRQAGVLWTLCDSRNPAQLYAIDRGGRLLGQFDVEGGVNLDWESLSIDDAGHLYVADVGNNLLVPMRWVYQVSEPDLNLQAEFAADGSGEAEARSGTIRVEKAFAYTFPGDPFDVEGTFVRGSAIYLVSKEPENGRLWSLPITESGPVQLTFECDLPDVNRATGADISPDGSELAICTYAEVLLYRLSSAEDGRLQMERTAAIGFQAEKVEGCCWSTGDVLLISEDRSIYSVSVPRDRTLPALTEPRRGPMDCRRSLSHRPIDRRRTRSAGRLACRRDRRRPRTLRGRPSWPPPTDRRRAARCRHARPACRSQTCRSGCRSRKRGTGP